jgi:uncharacterized protein
LTYIKRFSLLRIGRRPGCALVGIFLAASAAAAGVDPAEAGAFERTSRAAAQGSVEAMFELGNLYAFGIGVPPSEPDPDQRAAQFYFEAARRGHAGAQHALGILYMTGKGVQQDAAEAQKWFRRAAEQGHAASKPLLNSPAR